MASKVSNEALCSALLTHGTIKESAKALNITERTVYNMMADREFKQLYEYAQTDILNKCVSECQSIMLEAINVIADMMRDKKVSPQTRLQCANAIIKNSLSMYEVKEKLRDKAEKETRTVLDELEDFMLYS